MLKRKSNPQAQLRELIEERMKTGSDNAKAILKWIDRTRVTTATGSMFHLDVYAKRSETAGTVSLNAMAGMATGRSCITTYMMGEPPAETEQLLANKIEFVRALK